MGIKYFFYLKEAIGRESSTEDRPVYLDEYLVIFEYLVEVAKEYDLELVE